METFEEVINHNRCTEQVEPDTTSLMDGASFLRVRRRGCYVTKAQLEDPRTGCPVEVLYGEEDLVRPKISASHTMLPVGPYEGLGGQHGWPRWADYHQFTFLENKNHCLAFQAQRSDLGPALMKQFELYRHNLRLHTAVRNDGKEAEETSLGEHLYFYQPESELGEVKVNDQSLEELFRQSEVTSKILSGDPYFWPGFRGYAELKLSSGRHLKIRARALHQRQLATPRDIKEQMGMLIWHRSGTDSLCFEPTVGYNLDAAGVSHNQGIILKPQDELTIRSTVNLL